MSDSGVNIKISTTANTAGAVAATRSLETLETEVKQLTQQMRQLAVDSDAFSESRAKLASLNTEISALKTGKDAAAGSARNFGQAMLQGSRGVQDFAAAGIPGMVNNVEGLASALGLGASAAGGFTLAFVGIELLMRNWGSITAAFGGAEKAKEFWAAMTPDEAIAKRLQDIATAQERLADSYQRAADARKAMLDSQQAERDAVEQMKKNWEGIVPTAKERGDLPALPGMEAASPELIKAATNQAKAEADAAVKLKTFRDADKAVKDQEAKLKAINKNATFDEKLKLANAGDDEAIKGLNLRRNQAGQAESPGDYAKLDQLQASKQARAEKMRAKLPVVPGLTDGLTGDPEKDREKLAQKAESARAELQRLEQERYQKAQQAEAATAAQNEAAQATKIQARKDQDVRVSEAYRNDTVKPLPGEPPIPGLPPLPGVSAGADAQAGIPSAVAQQALQIQAAQQQVAQALQTQGGAVVNSLELMQQNLTATLSALTQKFTGLASNLKALDGEVQTLTENNRR